MKETLIIVEAFEPNVFEPKMSVIIEQENKQGK